MFSGQAGGRAGATARGGDEREVRDVPSEYTCTGYTALNI